MRILSDQRSYVGRPPHVHGGGAIPPMTRKAARCHSPGEKSGNSNPLAVTEYLYDELEPPLPDRSRALREHHPHGPPARRGRWRQRHRQGEPHARRRPRRSPGVSGITILGRVSDRTEYDRNSRVTFPSRTTLDTSRTLYDGANGSSRRSTPRATPSRRPTTTTATSSRRARRTSRRCPASPTRCSSRPTSTTA